MERSAVALYPLWILEIDASPPPPRVLKIVEIHLLTENLRIRFTTPHLAARPFISSSERVALRAATVESHEEAVYADEAIGGLLDCLVLDIPNNYKLSSSGFNTYSSLLGLSFGTLPTTLASLC